MKDYFYDYIRLRLRIRSDLMEEVLYKVAARYISNIASSGLELKSDKNRSKAAKRLREDGDRLSKFFELYMSGKEEKEVGVN